VRHRWNPRHLSGIQATAALLTSLLIIARAVGALS
jgi:hypothetical protein